LPQEITLQIPPNLVPDRQYVLAAIAHGARDLGGLGPKDEVNPDYHHPTPDDLRSLLAPMGWQLQPRLPVYPQYDGWLAPTVRTVVERWRDHLAQAAASSGSLKPCSLRSE